MMRLVSFLVEDRETDDPVQDWRDQVGNGEAEITDDEAAPWADGAAS